MRIKPVVAVGFRSLAILRDARNPFQGIAFTGLKPAGKIGRSKPASFRGLRRLLEVAHDGLDRVVVPGVDGGLDAGPHRRLFGRLAMILEHLALRQRIDAGRAQKIGSAGDAIWSGGRVRACPVLEQLKIVERVGLMRGGFALQFPIIGLLLVMRRPVHKPFIELGLEPLGDARHEIAGALIVGTPEARGKVLGVLGSGLLSVLERFFLLEIEVDELLLGVVIFLRLRILGKLLGKPFRRAGKPLQRAGGPGKIAGVDLGRPPVERERRRGKILAIRDNGHQ